MTTGRVRAPVLAWRIRSRPPPRIRNVPDSPQRFTATLLAFSLLFHINILPVSNSQNTILRRLRDPHPPPGPPPPAASYPRHRYIFTVFFPHGGRPCVPCWGLRGGWGVARAVWGVCGVSGRTWRFGFPGDWPRLAHIPVSAGIIRYIGRPSWGRIGAWNGRVSGAVGVFDSCAPVPGSVPRGAGSLLTAASPRSPRR